MKLKAEIAGESHEVHIKADGVRVYAEVNGRRYELEARSTGAGAYFLIMNGRVFECRIEADGAHGAMTEVHVGNHAYSMTLIDPKRLRGGQSAGAHADGATAQIVAPMPGKVVRLLVEQGAQVEAGQGIVVVEAMKMQNEMKSPRNGTVTALQAQIGATVKAGEVLAVIE